jgi:hypothetical protein
LARATAARVASLSRGISSRSSSEIARRFLSMPSSVRETDCHRSLAHRRVASSRFAPSAARCLRDMGEMEGDVGEI